MWAEMITLDLVSMFKTAMTMQRCLGEYGAIVH